MRIILCHFPQGQQSQANAQNWGLSHSFFYSWASDPKAGSCWAFIPSLGGNNGFQLHQGKEVFMVSLWGASTEGASFHPSSKFFGNNSSSINCPVKKKKSKNYLDWYLNVSTSKQVTMGCDVLVVHLTEHRKTHLGGSSWVSLWEIILVRPLEQEDLLTVGGTVSVHWDGGLCGGRSWAEYAHLFLFASQLWIQCN